jgi:PAS domain S-box-containing protein
MKFDAISMLLMLFLVCTGFSLAIFLAWRLLLPMRSLTLWATGIGCYGIGVLLIALRGIIPDLLSLVVANLFVLGCYGLFWIGLSLHVQKKPWYRIIILILLIFLPIYSWFCWGVPDIAIRTALIRVFILILLAGASFTLLHGRSAALSTMEKVLTGALSLDICFRLLILILQLATMAHQETIQKNMVAAISSMTSMTSMIAWGVAFVLLALERVTLDLHQTVSEREKQIKLNILHQQRLQGLLDISQFPAKDIQELLDYALQKVIEITRSEFGYIYHYHEDRQEFVLNSWSKGVMPACSVSDPLSLYKLEKTGIWGEAVRQRRPILVNDFAADNPLKKGYPEGHVHLTRFLTVPVFDLNQQIVAVVGVANKNLPYTDFDTQQLDIMMAEVWRIAKRLEMESKLIHAGHEWQTTFDAISDSVCLIDAEQRILRCNVASTRFFKCSFKEIIGQHCWKLTHGTDQPIEGCPMQRALYSRTTESQLIFEGNRWLHITVDPLLDEQGVLTGAVHIVHDDTERVESEQSQRDLLTMLEAVQNELYVINPDTLRFEYVNDCAQKNLGYTLSQLKQMTPLDVKPFTRQQFMQMIAPLVTGGQQLLRFETTHQRADGSIYPVEVNLQITVTQEGQRFLAVIHDITQRKQDLKEMQNMHAQLLQNEKMASIGQLSAGIAHEINNPMGFINSNLGTLEKYVEKFDRYIALLERLLQDSSDEHGRQEAAALRKALKLEYVLQDIGQLLHESAEGAERVMKIVQDLKTFSRSDTAQIARADLNQCLDSTINIIWNQIKYVADLKKEYGELPKVACNVQQINQVFMNLLVNASHAIETKGAEKLGTLRVRTWADNDNAFVSVSDTGCGMNNEVKSRIFDPFFTTKDVGQGTGLGLSISHEIIKKHGGEILVESADGAGTTFTIRLPITPPPRNTGMTEG